MPLKTLYLTDYCKIDADLERKLLRAQWLRPVDEQEARQVGAKLCQVLRETRLERLVIDTRALGTLDPGVKEWMSTSFFCLLSQSGLKQLGRVLPDSAFSRVSLKAISTRAEALGGVNFMLKNFTDEEQAYLWLGY
ncbi:hypothetical protein SAMN06296052_14813 [Pontibacter ummariensis]|uniref:SpoIIAA-like n=1 Tax=Pontibacter ummariensis TaxID=1610492 RepID=A0A239LSR3_9BACT|nr:hypothetical protein SAMN06296052_14813 [Pontibacter ummariensis]